MREARSILVTGGAGFIGSHLCERLLNEGQHQLVVVDNFDPFYDRAIKERNLSGFRDRVRFVELDLAESPELDAVFADSKPELVVHLAAKAGVRPSILNPVGYVAANVTATTRLFELAVKHGTRAFAFASSSSVYGDSTPVPFREDANVNQPISPYAATKRAAELMASTYNHLYELNVACLRFFTVYGPRQRPDLAIHKFAKKILKGETITLFGDGSTARDYTYIDDTIDGVMACAEWLLDRDDPCCEIFNLGNSHPHTLSYMVSAIERALATPARVEHVSMQPGDVVQTYASIDKAKAAFGYAPSVTFDQGLAHFAEWLKAHPGNFLD